MIRIRLIAVLFMILPFITETTSAQVVLTLDKTIELATDSSLQSFRLRNRYLASYWEHRSFKAARLPSLSLDLTPGSYYRANDKVYTNDQWEYRKQEYYIASGGLNITQNLDLLGGTFSVNTDLEYLRDFQAKNNVGGHKTQFNSVPVQIAYYQDLLGYNPFKWERKIQPLKFQKAKKELIYNMEQVSEIATEYFFN